MNISMHLTSIFENGELNENSVVKDFLITAADEKTGKMLTPTDKEILFDTSAREYLLPDLQSHV